MTFETIKDKTNNTNIYLYNNMRILPDTILTIEEAIKLDDDLKAYTTTPEEQEFFSKIVKHSICSFVAPAVQAGQEGIPYQIPCEPSIGTKIKDYFAVNESVQTIPGLQYPNEASGVINYQPNQDTFVQNHNLICEPEGTLTKTDKFREVLNQMAEIHDAKSAAYGDSFGQSIKNYGLIAALTRISDKFHRFENLVLHPDAGKGVTDESRKDTLIDMANYCIMTYLAMENEK